MESPFYFSNLKIVAAAVFMAAIMFFTLSGNSSAASFKQERAEFWRMDSLFKKKNRDLAFLKKYASLALKLSYWGRADRAISLIEELTPDDKPFISKRLISLIRLKEYSYAVEKGEQLVSEGYSSPSFYMNLAYAYLRTGSSVKAITMADKARSLAPSDQNIAASVALIYYEAGEAERALNLVNTVLSYSPDSPYALNLKGVIDFAAPDSHSYFSDAIALSSYLPSYCNKALLQYNAGNYKESALLLEGIENRYPDDVNLKIILAASLIKLGENRRAFLKIYEALEIAPSADLLSFAGIALFNIGDYENAGVYFVRALWLEPANTAVKNNLALCFKKRALYDRAASILKDALEDEPENPELLFNLANLYEVMGLKEEAVRYYRRFSDVSDREQAEGLIRELEREKRR